MSVRTGVDLRPARAVLECVHRQKPKCGCNGLAFCTRDQAERQWIECLNCVSGATSGT